MSTEFRPPSSAPSAAPAEPKAATKPFPTLLTKADAMLHAAEHLENRVHDMEMIHTLQEVFVKSGALKDHRTKDILDKIEDLRVRSSGIVDLELQKAAMQAAAKEIRAMANETKLVEARAAARGARL